MKAKNPSLALNEWLPESQRFERLADVQLLEIAANVRALIAFPTTVAEWQTLWQTWYGLSLNAIPIDGLGLISHVIWQEKHVFVAEPTAEGTKALRKYLQQQDIQTYTMLHSLSANELAIHRITHYTKNDIEKQASKTTTIHFTAIQPAENEENIAFAHRIAPIIQCFAPRTLWHYDTNIISKFWQEAAYLFGFSDEVHRYSLFGQTVFTLTQETMPRDYAKISAPYGSNTEKRTAGVAAWLSTIWLGRFLFLKQLETQLLRYHANDDARDRFRFLHTDWTVTIGEEGNDDAQTILRADTFAFWAAFMQHVLHTPTAQRKPEWQAQFSAIPYLNAAIFDITAMEENTLLLQHLSDAEGIEIQDNSLINNDLDIYYKNISRTNDSDTEFNHTEISMVADKAVHYYKKIGNAPFDLAQEAVFTNTKSNKNINFITYFLRLFARIDCTEIPVQTDWLSPSAAYQLPETVLTELVERWAAAQGGTYLSAAYANDFYHTLNAETTIFIPNMTSGRLLNAVLLHQLSQTNLVLRATQQSKQPPHYWLQDDAVSVILKDGTAMKYAIVIKNGLRKLPNCQSVQEAIFDAFHLIIQEKIQYSNELPHFNWLAMWHIYTFGLQFAVYKQGNNTQIEPFGKLEMPAQNGNILYDRQLTDDEMQHNSRTQQKIQRLKKIHYQTFATPTLLPTHHTEKEETRLLEEIDNLQQSIIQLPEQMPIPIVFFPKQPYHIVLFPPSTTPAFLQNGIQSQKFLNTIYMDTTIEWKYVQHLIGRTDLTSATILMPILPFKAHKYANFQRLANANNKQLFGINDQNSNKMLFFQLIEKTFEKSC